MKLPADCQFLPHDYIDDLLKALRSQNYHCLGPQVQQNAIVYAELNAASQLPWGIVEQHAAGSYSLQKTTNKHAFAWIHGPMAIKPNLFKPQESLWRVTRDAQGKLKFEPVFPEPKPLALFAVRSCDVQGLLVQDRTFVHDKYVDQHYQQQRRKLFLIVANCTTAGPNCFCISAGGYPAAERDIDLAFTEISKGLVLQGISDNAKNLLQTLKLNRATTQQIQQAEQGIAHAVKGQTKLLPKVNIPQKLFENLHHPRWQEVAERCLSCSNCTQVCPTCFCHREEDKHSMEENQIEHQRLWDSCFSKEHSYIHSKVIRPDIATRYRQWLTHKFGSWYEQFGMSGCVGCGRCITWCPVGIDVREELAAICGEDDD